MIEYEIKDMTCSHCTSTITRVVNETAPAATVSIDLPNHRVKIDGEYDADLLERAIREAGYTPIVKS